jgi:hypothetical protein
MLRKDGTSNCLTAQPKRQINHSVTTANDPFKHIVEGILGNYRYEAIIASRSRIVFIPHFLA